MKRAGTANVCVHEQRSYEAESSIGLDDERAEPDRALLPNIRSRRGWEPSHSQSSHIILAARSSLTVLLRPPCLKPFFSPVVFGSR